MPRVALRKLSEPYGLVWLGFGGAALVLVASGLIIQEPKSYFHTGVFLQMIGIASTVVGLELRRRDLGGQSIRTWLKRTWDAIRGKPQTVGASLNTVFSIAGKAYPTIQMGFADSDTQDEKIEKLRRQINQIEKRITEIDKSKDEDIKAIKTELREDIKAISDQSKGVEQKLHQVELGGIHVEIAGIVWLGVGLLCSAYPETLYCIFDIAITP
jgi:hypothetical protein